MSSLSRRWIAIGALLGAIGVGTRRLRRPWLAATCLKDLGYAGDDLARRLDIFETAIRYQMLHALALVVTGLALEQSRSVGLAVRRLGISGRRRSLQRIC